MDQNPSTWWSVIFTATAQAAIAGALGGAVRWMTLREDWRQGLVSIFVGAVCAVYLGPLATTGMDTILGQVIEDPIARQNLGTFMVGIGGVGVVGFVMDFWKNRREAMNKGREDQPPGGGE